MNKKNTAQAFPRFILVFLPLFYLHAFAPQVSADIIKLKNGNAMETKILKEDENFLTVQAPGGKVKVPKKEIENIWRGSKEDLLQVQGKEVLFAKGVELYNEGKFREAAETFGKTAQGEGVNAIVYANIATSHAPAGEAKKAEENFLKALEKEPGNSTTLLNAGHFYESLKNYKTAAFYYGKALESQWNNLKTKRSLAYCLYMEGEHTEAARLFEEIGKNNDAVALCNATASYIQAGNLDQASSLLERLLDSSSPVPRVYLLMGEIARQRKDYDGAEEYYKKALERDHDAAKVKTCLGWLYLDTQNWTKAETVFYEVLAKDPGSAAAMQGLAQSFTQKGEYQKAIAQYEALAAKDPGDWGAQTQIGLAYLKINDPQNALKVFREALARNDQNAKAHTNAGLAYALMNDAENALKEWNRALELDPQLVPALQNKKILEEAMRGQQIDQGK